MSLVINGVETFVGCVVDEYEENYYDESYFYGVVWTGKGFKTVMVDTTAHGGCGVAEVDAPEELLTKYRRHLLAKALFNRRDNLIEIARQNGLPSYTVLNSIAKVYGSESKALKACAQLLGTKKFRSSFRASLRQQLDAWLRGEVEYATPFSPRQIASLVKTVR